MPVTPSPRGPDGLSHNIIAEPAPDVIRGEPRAHEGHIIKSVGLHSFRRRPVERERLGAAIRISRVAEGRALARLLAVDLKIGLGCEGATCVEIKILRRVRIVASSSTPARRRVPYRSTSPTHWLISTQGAAQTIADRTSYSTGFKQQILEPDE